MDKSYLSRAQTRAMAADMPIGDPFGGPAYGERNDPITAIAGGSVAGGLVSGVLGDRASKRQAASADRATDVEREMYYQSREDQMPWLTTGKEYLGKLSDYADSYTPFTGESLTSDPGYQFGLKEGINAINTGAASNGTLLSGKRLRDLAQFGQDYAGTKFNEAFQRNLAERSNRYNELAGIAGTGQTAAQSIGSYGANTASNIGNYATQAGNARAAALTNWGNSVNNTLGNIGNLYMSNDLLKRYSGSNLSGI